MADPASAPIPPTIANHEKLGRHEWSGTSARKVQGRQIRGESLRVQVNRFKPPDNSCELSVDRMDHATLGKLAELAEQNTTRQNVSLRGWYTLSATDVAEAKCNVQSSPFPENPYHADIVIPVNLGAADSRDALIEYAWDLAYRAGFEPWGGWQSEDTADSQKQPSPSTPPAADPSANP